MRGAVIAAIVGGLALTALAWAGTQPLFARLRTEPALSGRLEAWRAAVRMAADFHIAGTGLNTFSTAMLFYQPPMLTARWEFVHNDYLQLFAEGGWLVVAPTLVCGLIIARSALRQLRVRQSPLTLWLRIGAMLGLIALGIQETVDFSLQLPGVSALFAVFVGFTIFEADPL
jgi:O-antigen ligase